MARRKALPEYQIKNVRLLDDLPTQAPQTVAIEQIKLPAKQPRRYFDPEKLQQLEQSIKEHGILEPLLVRPLQTGEYELVAGERRLRAAQQAQLTEVPIVSKTLTDQEALQVSLMENLQREDLNPIEETEAVLELLAITLDTQPTDIVSLLNQSANAKRRGQNLTDSVIRQIDQIESMLTTIGRFNAESFRANRIPLLNLPNDVLTSLRQGQLEFSKARVIARIKDAGQRKKFLQEVIQKNLPLSEVRDRIKAIQAPSSPEPPSLQSRIDTALKIVKQSKAWDDPKKRKKLEKLLADLETLAAES